MNVERLKARRRDLVDMLKLDIDLMRRAEILIEIDELTKEIKRRENNHE